MSFKPLLIAPVNQGIREDLDSWLIPEDAFESLEDTFIIEGKVVKKPGYQLLGRLQKQVTGESVGAAPGPSYSGTLANTPVAPEFLTITDGTKSATDDGAGGFTGDVSAGTINYLTGAYTITFDGATVAPVTATYDWYPISPCMGLAQYEVSTTNFEDLIAFDQTSSYIYDRSDDRFEHITGAAVANDNVWSSNNNQFFSTCNYWTDSSQNPLFWAVNGKALNTHKDGIKYYNGTTWTSLQPAVNAAGTTLDGGRIIIPFKNRLLIFNTVENAGGAKSYPNRVRWSQNGTPLVSVDSDAWKEDVIGKGGYLDATTNEAITAVVPFFGSLIVYFERSTWKLRYTGEDLLPFRFERISNEFGCEGVHCPIAMDAGAFAIGDKRISFYDGSVVRAADEAIPRFVFTEINNDNNSIERVAGIRDLYFDMIYWCYPSSAQDRTYPDKVLVLDYKTGAYSKWNESFTCFSYFQDNTDITWAEATFEWMESNRTWRGSALSAIPEIVAGNQQGFVLQLNRDRNIDEPSLNISAINTTTNTLTITYHNLLANDYILVEDCVGITGINDTIFKIKSITDANNIVIEDASLSGTYTGAGVVRKVSNFDVTTKRLNIIRELGSQTRISYIDLLLETTNSGEITCQVRLDNSKDPVITKTILTSHEIGIDGDYEWHRVLINSTAQSVQLKLYMDDTQMEDEAIAGSLFILHGMIIWVAKAGRIIGI